MTNSLPAQFILASQSPRRADLLARLGYRFAIRPADIDESRLPQEAPDVFVQRLAQEKAAAIVGESLPVLGADTIVVLEGEILGKPQGREDALRMLRALSGSSHQVLTAVCVRDARRCELVMSSTQVRFADLSNAELQAYWASGEPEGKAGAYGIQGLAEAFVQTLEGSYSGVVGLPLQQTRSLLKLFDVHPPALSP